MYAALPIHLDRMPKPGGVDALRPLGCAQNNEEYSKPGLYDDLPGAFFLVISRLRALHCIAKMRIFILGRSSTCINGRR